ncbi:HEAT repeat domain-containing protein [uncultured Pseudomonas sp.]|uniref:HEAT repeat domain-containing protein n=1 Tax=uncultured Pseudomonas sp. TaxID=114707 RepID=UPI0025D734A5|nr:HEAT repeat domain-containing protein [uncultured Pseudomonas sp.]
MDKQGAIDLLITTLNDRTMAAEVRVGAAAGLGHIAAYDVRAALAKVVQDRTGAQEVRAAAAKALGQAAG